MCIRDSFCTAKPSLVVNHIDTIAHFLKHEQALKAVRHVCEMLPMLLRILDHPKKSLLMTLETYLAALVFRVQETLLQAAIPALCMTIKSSGNKVLLINILTKFYQYLVRFLKHLRESDPEPGKPLKLPANMTLGHVYRSILSCGLLCQHYDFDVIDTGLMDGENVVLPAGKVTEGVHKLLAVSYTHLTLPTKRIV